MTDQQTTTPDPADRDALSGRLRGMADAGPCKDCYDLGFIPADESPRDSDGAPYFDEDQPCPKGCEIPRWLRAERAELDRALAELAHVRPVVDAARSLVQSWDDGTWQTGPRGTGYVRDLYAALDGDAAATPQPAVAAAGAGGCGHAPDRARRDEAAMSDIWDGWAGLPSPDDVAAEMSRQMAGPDTVARRESLIDTACRALDAFGTLAATPPADVPARLREAAAAVERVRDGMTTHPGAYRKVIDALTLLGRWLAADPEDPAAQAVARALAGPTTDSREG